MAVSTMARALSQLSTLCVSTTAVPPASSISRFVSSAGLAEPPSPVTETPISLTTKEAPVRASARATSRPMPPPAPETIATFPSFTSDLPFSCRTAASTQGRESVTQDEDIAVCGPCAKGAISPHLHLDGLARKDRGRESRGHAAERFRLVGCERAQNDVAGDAEGAQPVKDRPVEARLLRDRRVEVQRVGIAVETIEQRLFRPRPRRPRCSRDRRRAPPAQDVACRRVPS